MSLDSEVAALTRVTTQLLSEVNVTSSSLSDKATTASNEATSAAGRVTTAEGYKSQALGHTSSAVGLARSTRDAVSYSLLPEGVVSDIATDAAASVFVYDTTKDSDGGAWRHRTQNTSWYDETDAPTGAWLGVYEDETSARLANLRTGPEIVSNGGFDSDSDWTKGTGWSIANGVAVAEGSTSDGRYFEQNIGLVSGKTYSYEINVSGNLTGSNYLSFRFGGSSDDFNITSGSGLIRGNVTASGSGNLRIRSEASSTDITIDNVSVKEITDYGSEEITSGDFSSASALDDFSTTGTVTYDSGKARLQPSSELRQFLYGTDNVSGTYHITWKQTLISGTRTRLLARNFANSNYLTTAYFNGSGVMSAIVNTTDGVMFRLSSDNSEVQIDNISVRKIDLQTAAGEYYQKSTSSNFFKLNAFGSGEAQVYRGSRKEFPAVAVIVLEENKVTIYNGDDPSMPMWMVFETPSTGTSNETWIGRTNIDFSSVFMLNGILAFGSKSSGDSRGLHLAYFVSDRLAKLGTNYAYNSGFVPDVSGIVNRNLGSTHVDGDGPVLGERTIYDIKMTVLPSAPIDTYTGLPVPTFALGTPSNVEFIRDDGTVFEVNYGSFDEDTLAFNEDWTLMMAGRHADRSPKTYIGDNEFAIEVHGGNNTQRIGTLDIEQGTGAQLGTDQSSAKTTNTIKWMFGRGFTRLKVNTDNFSDSMVCSTSDVYTSGWLVGDIKGAFLADTDSTNASGGPEYVVGGDFDDATKWTATDGSTVSGGVLNIADGTINETIYNSGGTAFPAGKQAIVTFTIINSSANFGVRLCTCRTNNGAIISTQGGTYYTADGTYTVTSLISDTHDWVIGFQRIGSHTGTLQIDNVSVKLAEPDRSYRNDGILVNGTITKTPVATGAELVSYSNWSGANYLQQEYNSNLDFGTGDFCMMVWAKDHGVFDTFLARSDNVNSSTELIWQTANTADSYRLYIGGQQIYASGLGFPTEGWHLHTVVRRSGSIYLYHDGEQVYTTSSVGGNSVTQSGAVLQVGIAKDVAVVIGADVFSGEMALLRISGTAPTAEQIKKIYEDERHLFKENAACAMYGTTHRLNDFAYDEDTELLHVGTNSGRSSFSGLVRVDEKVGDITTAISAANGLIVED